ncbi:hypothetical protein KIW84_061200 [Lathyrus oleraceus]|uniref:Uncharacterized protein n=1 Tax=Pisum sativum TaxID=3888 RepID=A0A9D4W4C1_PEA|nr:hypothetical protein KIW84_061200 [Pisum sativum]
MESAFRKRFWKSSIPRTHNHRASRRHQWRSRHSLFRSLSIETHFISSPSSLHFSGNTSHSISFLRHSQIQNQFPSQNPKPQFYQVPVEITADLPVNHRHSLYSSGFVCFITPRILIVDLLTNKLPASIISGLIILNAHSVSETSTEAFIVRIFRSLNRSAFVRVFSDRPQAMVSGFAKAERTMKCLHIRKLHLWPRFQVYVSQELEQDPPDVVDIRVPMSKYMMGIQKAIVEVMGACLKEMRKTNKVDVEDLTVENGLFKSFDEIVKRQLDPIWHTLGKQTKQLVSDLKTLRKLLDYLVITVLLIIIFIATSNEDVEYKYLPSCPDDEPQKKINQGTILSNIQWKKFGLLCFVWIAVLLLQIAKALNFVVFIDTSYCWGFNVPSNRPISRKKITVSKQDHGTHWPLHLLIVSLSCALLAGILGGLLGVGSGFVMGPLFIEFGIAPQVASATATLGMTFTASISVAQYFLLNRFLVPYALYLTIVATIAAYIGQKIIDRLVNIFQRAYLIIFVLSFTILVSAIALGEYDAVTYLKYLDTLRVSESFRSVWIFAEANYKIFDYAKKRVYHLVRSDGMKLDESSKGVKNKKKKVKGDNKDTEEKSSRNCVYQLGSVQSLLPLHNTVATCRMVSNLSVDSRNCHDVSQVNAKLAAAEEALSLSVWTTSTTCRVLSLDTLLALLTGVLLEKQVVIVCPNLVGIQHKPDDLYIKTSNLVEVNVMQNQVKMCHLPRLPRQRDLVSQLTPIHARLSSESYIAKKHPIHRCNEIQVSLLLKDTFIDSFPLRDQPFIKLFIDTQIFTVLSDSYLSSFESGKS